MSVQRYSGLDVMRTAAVLLVLISHSVIFLPFETGKIFLFEYLGFIGVEVFFVLSGFLIGNIMFKSFAEKVDGPVMKTFWIRRWFRTLPLYFITLLLNILLSVFYAGTSGLELRILLFPLFLQNFLWPHPHFFEPAWSLTIEEYFYLLFPLLMYLLYSVMKFKFKKSFLLAIGLFFLIPLLLRVGFYFIVDFGVVNQFKADFSPNWDLHFRKITLFRLDGISLGILTAYLLNTANNTLLRLKDKLFGGGLLLLIAATVLFYYKVHFYKFGFFSSVLIFPMFSVSFAMMLPYLRQMNTVGIFNKPVSFISKVSYSIYLLHSLVSFLFVKHLLISDHPLYMIFIWVLFITASILISAYSFKYIEHPMTEMRERFDRPGPKKMSDQDKVSIPTS